MERYLLSCSSAGFDCDFETASRAFAIVPAYADFRRFSGLFARRGISVTVPFDVLREVARAGGFFPFAEPTLAVRANSTRLASDFCIVQPPDGMLNMDVLVCQGMPTLIV